ncbi:hypothetical protein BB559_000037 [Furculomyces boomerangus]|uniref:Small ribosomal subunit protein mS35 mitochondrial conserved domain-containing protein n=2 Tax=Harpellales TaxID=61421 RepID=A0A2T9Z6N7_9FUNG|nr:hypothetical protein BB559_000037 [Furculomyces boomerangus]PWA01369.1 hypothetical protein BB558_002535 [Smittium angustum]
MIKINTFSKALNSRLYFGKNQFVSAYATKAGSEPVAASAEGQDGEKRKHQPAYGRKRRMQFEKNRERVFDINQLDTWKGDDHHIFGHWLLNSVRDVRKYIRKEKYEVPTLANLAKPFVLPSTKNILKFQINRVHGKPEDPLNQRVTLFVKVSELNLAKKDLHKFLLLAGPRYNSHTDILTISSDTEPTSLLNKKLLSDTLDELIKEATTSKDKFEDIPLLPPKNKGRHIHQFPKEWMPDISQ